jgi:hypothetical protein
MPLRKGKEEKPNPQDDKTIQIKLELSDKDKISRLEVAV